jgi:hypothetical protein
VAVGAPVTANANSANTGVVSEEQMKQLPTKKAETAEKPQAAMANQKAVQQGSGPAVIASAVLAEIQAVDSRVKDKASLNSRVRLNAYIRKAGNNTKRAQFVSANPNWLTGLKGWNDHLVQQVKTLEGQKSTLKTKKAISDLKKMIGIVKPILDQSTNLIAPVAKNNAPKTLTSQQKLGKKREQKAALKAKQAEERAAAKKQLAKKAAPKNAKAVDKKPVAAQKAEADAAAKKQLANKAEPKKQLAKKEAGNNQQKAVNQKPVAPNNAAAVNKQLIADYLKAANKKLQEGDKKGGGDILKKIVEKQGATPMALKADAAAKLKAEKEARLKSATRKQGATPLALKADAANNATGLRG